MFIVTVTVRTLAGMVGVRVRNRVMYYVLTVPTQTETCVCVCMHV